MVVNCLLHDHEISYWLTIIANGWSWHWTAWPAQHFIVESHIYFFLTVHALAMIFGSPFSNNGFFHCQHADVMLNRFWIPDTFPFWNEIELTKVVMIFNNILVTESSTFSFSTGENILFSFHCTWRYETMEYHPEHSIYVYEWRAKHTRLCVCVFYKGMRFTFVIIFIYPYSVLIVCWCMC